MTHFEDDEGLVLADEGLLGVANPPDVEEPPTTEGPATTEDDPLAAVT
jgi:hypothetical protein